MRNVAIPRRPQILTSFRLVVEKVDALWPASIRASLWGSVQPVTEERRIVIAERRDAEANP